MASDSDEVVRRTLERIKELDHAHRTRARTFGDTGPGLALSLRFLRTALAHLTTPTIAVDPERVPRPPEGAVAVTWVGHASVLLSTPRTRVLTDPLFTNILYGLRRARAARVHASDVAEVGLVLVSHAHADHLHVPSLRLLPRGATLVVPPRCAHLVERLGFARVVVLEPGQDLACGDVVVTGVAAKHDGGGLLGGPWRGAGGYVVRAEGVTTYFAGDTAYFSGFAELGRRMRPDVALLPIAGYEPMALREGHMSPLDALAAFEDLGAQLLVPIAYGSFPLGYEPLDEPASWLRQLCAERGLLDRLRLLEHGETCVVRRPASVPAGNPRADL